MKRTPAQLEAHRLRQVKYRARHRLELNAKQNALSKTAGAKEKRRAYYRRNTIKMLLTEARKRARQRNLQFNLMPEHLSVPEFCPVLHIPIIPGGPQSNWPSLDRHDNTQGYVVGNVCVISHRANCLKRDATADELELVLSYVRGW